MISLVFLVGALLGMLGGGVLGWILCLRYRRQWIRKLHGALPQARLPSGDPLLEYRQRNVRAARELKTRIAAHEGGHILAAVRGGIAEIAAVTIQTHVNAEGQLLEGVAWVATPTRLHWERLVCALGGIAGEMVVHGKMRSGGAHFDLEYARDLAEEIVARGTPAPWPPRGSGALPFDRMFRTPLTPEVGAVLLLAYREAKARLCDLDGGASFVRLIERLLERGTLAADEILSLVGDHNVPDV